MKMDGFSWGGSTNTGFFRGKIRISHCLTATEKWSGRLHPLKFHWRVFTPEEWMGMEDDCPFLLRQKAYFQGRTVKLWGMYYNCPYLGIDFLNIYKLHGEFLVSR